MQIQTQFSAVRKQLVQDLKALLTNPAYRPQKDSVYGNKIQVLFLRDYALYAVARGADFRKTSHLRESGAPNARDSLELIAFKLKYILENPQLMSSGKYDTAVQRRYLVGLDKEYDPSQLDLYLARAREIRELIERALA